jgi:hypothetical protein
MDINTSKMKEKNVRFESHTNAGSSHQTGDAAFTLATP